MNEIFKGLKSINELDLLPHFYFEDICVRLAILICRDRFVDNSVSQEVILPVSNEACKLAANIFINHKENCIRIIDELLNTSTINLKLSAWLLIKYISEIDNKFFDYDWVYAHFSSSITEAHENHQYHDVITYSIDAIYNSVENIKHASDFAEIIWNEFMNFEPDHSFNANVLNCTAKLLQKCDVSYFATNEGLATIFKCILEGSRIDGIVETREAAYSLLSCALDKEFLDIWQEYDMQDLIQQLIELNLNEGFLNSMH